MTTVPVADARAHLSSLIDEAESTHQRVEITRNGRRAAVLMSVDDYDAVQEMIAVLSDAGLLAAHREGVHALAAGDLLDRAGLDDLLRRAGRPTR